MIRTGLSFGSDGCRKFSVQKTTRCSGRSFSAILPETHARHVKVVAQPDYSSLLVSYPDPSAILHRSDWTRPNPGAGTETVYQCYQTLSASLNIKWRMGLGTRLRCWLVSRSGQTAFTRKGSGTMLVWLARPSHLTARGAKGKGRSSGSND